MPEFKVITMSTEIGGYMLQMLESSRRFDLNPVVLGMGEPWTCHMMKLRLLDDYFRRRKHAIHDLILWVDAYDCLFQRGRDQIIEAFRSYDKPLVFSSEQTGGWPLPANLFPEGPYPYRGICAGVWMGEFWAIRQMLDVFDAHNLPDEYPGDDQGLIQAYAFIKPGICAIDNECRLAQTMATGEPNPNTYDAARKTIYNDLTRTVPCVLHGAAGYDMTAILETLGV